MVVADRGEARPGRGADATQSGDKQRALPAQWRAEHARQAAGQPVECRQQCALYKAKQESHRGAGQVFDQPPDKDIPGWVQKAVHLRRGEVVVQAPVQRRPAIVEMVVHHVEAGIARPDGRERAEGKEPGRPGQARLSRRACILPAHVRNTARCHRLRPNHYAPLAAERGGPCLPDNRVWLRTCCRA